MTTALTAAGLLGAAVAVVAYLLLVRGAIRPSRGYAGLSLLASALIGASLVAQFNAATLVIQLFFSGVSLYALTRPA